jgi:hypothetical protein
LATLINNRSFCLTAGLAAKSSDGGAVSHPSGNAGAVRPQIVKFFLYFQVVVAMCR